MLTQREQDTLVFISKYQQQHGIAPRLTDIATGLCIQSKSHIHRLLTALENKGHIARSRARRDIRIIKPLESLHKHVDKKPPELGLPFVGQIAAGNPFEAIENCEFLDINSMFNQQQQFILQIKGDSMQDIGILDKDWVVIKQQNHAPQSTVVVAIIDGTEATLKRIDYVDESAVYLIPENKSMQPQKYHRERITIQGVLVGQFRKYN